MKLKSIKAERAACLAAFRKYPRAKHAWCVHHFKLYERISFTGIQERIAYIDANKERSEQACRFRNMRPVKPTKERRTAALFRKQWPDNTWNGYDIGV